MKPNKKLFLFISKVNNCHNIISAHPTQLLSVILLCLEKSNIDISPSNTNTLHQEEGGGPKFQKQKVLYEMMPHYYRRSHFS